MNLKLKQIKVGERFRKDFGNLAALSESILAHGLIHPIVVESLGDDLYSLVAGERRLRACVLLGWDEVPVTTRDALEPVARRELELEENLHRKDLNWTEEVQIKLEIDELKRELYGNAIKSKSSDGWSREKLAESLGESKGKVVQDLQLAEFIRKNPHLKETYSKLPKTTVLRKIKQIEAEEQARVFSQNLQSEVLKNCDALEGLSKLEDSSVDLLLTDPPYASKEVSGENDSSKQSLMVESDNLTREELTDLLRVISPELFRVLKPGRHFYCFIAIENYDIVSRELASAGLFVRTTPLVWAKGKNMTAGTGLNYMRSYELILYGHKPTSNGAEVRALSKHSIDTLSFPPINVNEQIQAFEKPEELLSFLIGQSSLQYELVLDPFAGSGSTLRAALRSKRRALGFEMNEKHYVRALEKLKKEG